MESSNLTLIMISAALIPFLLPVVILLDLLVYRYKAGKMATFTDFKDKIRILKSTDDFSIDDYGKELLCKKAKLTSIKNMISKCLAVIFFNTYLIIIINISRYDLVKHINHNAQLNFPIVEITTLILLSTWISAMLVLNLSVHRINLYIEKLSQLNKDEKDL